MPLSFLTNYEGGSFNPDKISANGDHREAHTLSYLSSSQEEPPRHNQLIEELDYDTETQLDQYLWCGIIISTVKSECFVEGKSQEALSKIKSYS